MRNFSSFLQKLYLLSSLEVIGGGGSESGGREW
jgi:hypothetical protein